MILRSPPPHPHRPLEIALEGESKGCLGSPPPQPSTPCPYGSDPGIAQTLPETWVLLRAHDTVSWWWHCALQCLWPSSPRKQAGRPPAPPRFSSIPVTQSLPSGARPEQTDRGRCQRSQRVKRAHSGVHTHGRFALKALTALLVNSGTVDSVQKASDYTQEENFPSWQVPCPRPGALEAQWHFRFSLAVLRGGWGGGCVSLSEPGWLVLSNRKVPAWKTGRC